MINRGVLFAHLALPAMLLGQAKPTDPSWINPVTGLGSVSSTHYEPLTGSERRHLYLKQNFTSIGAATAVMVPSIFDQLGKQPPEWGSSAEGFSKRLASRFGTAVVQGSVQAAGCAVLGQDPRYIRSSSTGVARRAGHALLFTFLTYNEAGRPRPALATLGSYYASSMATTLWLPGRYTPLGDGVRDGTRQVLFGALVNQVQEFWPEIRRILRRR
jgi:hypothetical protein